MGVLDTGRILTAAEDVLRRYGPGKTTVVDVARVLGVSHGAVYRHFPSKAALRDAVAERWLARISAPLDRIVDEPGPAAETLRRWLGELSGTKRRMAREDPELFATFQRLSGEAREVAAAHLDILCAQIARILARGAAGNEFVVTDAAVTARAVLHATARFHHPLLSAEWTDPDLDTHLDAVWALILNGLRGTDPPGTPTRSR